MSRSLGLGPLWRRLVDSPRWLSALGVLAAGVIAVQANVLVARHYERWDFTSHGSYTLSQATRDLLGSLSAPVEVNVLLSRSDRLIVDTRHMLDAYRAVFPDLLVRYVDPDADPAQFLALQQRHGIALGTTQDGQVVTDASLIVSQADRHWFIAPADLVRFDDEGQAQPRLEAALTEGIARVVTRELDRVCFTSGHGESSLDDGGSQGLAELRRRLERSNLLVEGIPLDGPSRAAGDPASSLAECRLVVVAGPERALGRAAAERLRDFVEGGGNLLLLLSPVVDGDGRLLPTGLESAARAAGIEIEPAFVVETDRGSRLPQGIGEAFLARPRVHPITRGLALSDEHAEARPLLVAAQPLRPRPDAPSWVLLESSPEAFALEDLRALEMAGADLSRQGRGGPHTLAVAAELPQGPTPRSAEMPGAPGAEAPGVEARGARVVVVGAANLAWSRNWRDPALFGTRLFVENAVAWLADRPALVSVPERPRHAVGLSVTEESLGEIERYVLIYMPLTAALGGVLLLLRRRRTEQLSRREEAR